MPQLGQVLVCANGRWPSREVWQPLTNNADLIIACDGAIHQCLELGIVADVLIGDLDSLDPTLAIDELLKGGLEIIKVENQDNNDLAKALVYAQSLDADSIDVIGVSGGRLDHRFASLAALCETSSKAVLRFDNGNARLVPKQGLELESIEIEGHFSLFAMGEVRAVELQGCKWPIHGEDLHTSTRGLHNEPSGEKITVSHQGGNLLLIIDN